MGLSRLLFSLTRVVGEVGITDIIDPSNDDFLVALTEGIRAARVVVTWLVVAEDLEKSPET